MSAFTNPGRRKFLISAGSGVLLSQVGPVFAQKKSFKTIEPGVLTVAMTGDVPMSSVENGKIVGMDGDVIAAIAERMGLVAKPSLMEWVATIEAVRTGRADVMIGNVGWTQKRSEIIALTDPVYFLTRSLVQRKGAGISKVSDLVGKKVGTVQGFVSIPDLRRVPGIESFNLYDSPDACIRDLMAGRLDAAPLDGVVMDYVLKNNPDWGLEQRAIEPDPEYAFLTGRNHAVFGMGMENCELFHAVNEGIAWAHETGVIRTALAKYLPDPDLYLAPIENHHRIGVDRDAQGRVIGALATCA